MAAPLGTYHFTLEAVGRCERNAATAEYWLRVAAHALQQAGFAMDDAQVIGIDGGPGAAINFPDPSAPVLSASNNGASDTRRMSSEGAPFR